MNHHDHQPRAERPSTQGPSRSKAAFAVFLAIALFFLLAEHRAHLLGYLPFLLIIACVLMHLFHHGRHGGSGTHRRATDGSAGRQRDTAKET